MSASTRDTERSDTYRPRAYSIEDAAREVGIGRTLMFDLVRRGEVRTVRFGRRRVVPALELDRLMSEGT